MFYYRVKFSFIKYKYMINIYTEVFVPSQESERYMYMW
jgi:hypothetical protein